MFCAFIFYFLLAFPSKFKVTLWDLSPESSSQSAVGFEQSWPERREFAKTEPSVGHAVERMIVFNNGVAVMV